MKNLAVLMILVCLYGCSPVQIAGTTDETELSIKGCVTSDQGIPVSGITVQLFTKGVTTPLIEKKSAANGLFKFENMTPGTYSLWAEEKDSIAASSGMFTLSVHDSASHNLILARTGSLTAYVKLPDGESPKKIIVSVPGTPRVTTADSLGNINVFNMATGNFSLLLKAGTDDFDPTTRQFTITGALGDTLKDTIVMILRNPKPTSNNLWAITSGKGTTIAVGSNGTVLSSTDGINWTNNTSDQIPLQKYDFYGAAWGNNTFVTLANNGIIVRSPDGISWSDSSKYQMQTIIGNSPEKIVFANNQFVVYDLNSTTEIETGTIWTSKDAIEWISHDVTFLPEQIVGNGSDFIASTSDGIFVSSDAQNWIKTDTMFVQSIIQRENNQLLGIHYKLIDGYNCKTQIVSSNNGHHWAVTCDSLCSGGRYFLWGKNRYNLFNRFSKYGVELFTSLDGKTWINEGSLDTPFYGDFNMGWDGERFICIGGNGLITTSRDGIHWNDDAMIGDYTTTLVWNGKEFAGVRAGMSIFSSTGSKWTKKMNDLQSGEVNSLSWGNGKYITESGPYAYISPDALHWTEVIIDSNYKELQRIDPDSLTLFKVVAGGNRFVAYAYPNHFYVSIDGLAWKRTDVPSDSSQTYFFGRGLLFYKDSQFVAVDNNGLIYISRDGFTWVTKDAEFVTGDGTTYGAASPDIMIIVNSYSMAAVSQDNGNTWKSSPSPEINTLSSLLWDGDQFVATTSEAFWTSTDGFSWRRRGDIPLQSADVFRGSGHKIVASAFNGSNYVIITNTGSIYTINKFTN